MHAPQIIMIVLLAMGFATVVIKHGQPREPYSIFSWSFAAAVELGLMYWGGFFG